MECVHHLIVVAFVRSSSGRVRLLLSVDRDGEPLADGEPLLLFEHRPGNQPDEATLEGADGLDLLQVAAARAAVATALIRLIDAAFDATGSFDGSRMLGLGANFRADPHAFMM